MVTSQTFVLRVAAALLWSGAQLAQALVFCVTNEVDPHRSAPVGELADSGWNQTAPIDWFLGTVIHANAMLTAKHISEITVGDTFSYEGQTHSVTAKVDDAGSDLTLLFFTGAVTNLALLNIETNDIASRVVLQGRGVERGDPVVTGGLTNGWKWGPWPGSHIRRWGVNHYVGASEDGLLALAAFDKDGGPDACMASVGDSGGPGFIRTGSGWKLATVTYSVFPARYTASTNPAAPFFATLFDYSGLFYDNEAGSWIYEPPGPSPAPGLLAATRTAPRLAWLTNTLHGIVFPADLGLLWRCETNAPPPLQAAAGLRFELCANNAGPYTARDVAIDVTWGRGLRVLDSAATHGTFAAGRWLLPALEDGCAATLRVDTAVWLSSRQWTTNRATVARSDKPDAVLSNDAAECALLLPETATRLLLQ